MTENHKKKTIVCSSGRVVELVGVSPFEIAEVQALVEMPEVPKRVLKTVVDGFDEIEQLTAENILTEDEQKIWDEYAAARRLAIAERDKLVMDFILMEGIRYDTDDMERWIEKRKRWGLPVPEDERERAITYVKTAVVGSVADLNNIIEGVMAAQGIDEATMKSISATFQRATQPNAAGRSEDSEGEMDV